jgi:hypothetical protein
LLKTNAQKKWAVKTRPFGREGHIVTLPAPGCKRPRVKIAEKSPLTRQMSSGKATAASACGHRDLKRLHAWKEKPEDSGDWLLSALEAEK